MTVGARYSSESKDGHTEISDTSVTNPSLSSGPYSKTWTALTPKALLSYEPVSNVMAYVSATKGFESGGFDNQSHHQPTLAPRVHPQKGMDLQKGQKRRALAHSSQR